MSDGHTGVDNKKLNQGGSGGFVLVLAALTQSTGETDWVIHAKSQSWQRHNRFLTDSGLAYYSGHCLFHDDSCHYGVIGRVVRDGDGDTDVRRMREMHDAFETFAGNVGHLFDLWQQQAEILRQIGIDPPAKPFFGPPARIVANAGGVPAWVEDEKFPQLRDWEKKRADIDSQVQELSVFLPLLYETGDRLRDAVISGLRLLGLDAEPTEPGFTVDITARTRDGSRRFGIEVTGIEEGIKKSSSKLTQVMAFEQKKDDDEKTILLANTYRGTAIVERKDLEHFTPQALNFLKPYPVLVMTTCDLYRMVGDILEGRRDKEELVEVLYATRGRLDYNSR